MMLTRCLMAVLLAACWVSPAPADQNDRRLDGLFAQLQSTRDAAEAAAIQERIWGLWFQSEDADVKLWMRMGNVALNQGRHEMALAAFDRVVKEAPEFAEGWNRRATLHYLMGSYAASVRDVASASENREPRAESRPESREPGEKRSGGAGLSGGQGHRPRG